MVENIMRDVSSFDGSRGKAAPTRLSRSHPTYRPAAPKSVRGSFGKQTITIELPDLAELDATESLDVTDHRSVDQDCAEIVRFLVGAPDVGRMTIKPLLIDVRVGERRYAHSPLAVIVHRGRTTIVDVEAATGRSLRKAAVRAAGTVLRMDVMTIGTDYLHTSSFLASVARIASDAKTPIFDRDVADIEQLMARCRLAGKPTTCGMGIFALASDQKARRKMHALIARGYLQLGIGVRLHSEGLLTAGPALGFRPAGGSEEVGKAAVPLAATSGR